MRIVARIYDYILYRVFNYSEYLYGYGQFTSYSMKYLNACKLYQVSLDLYFQCHIALGGSRLLLSNLYLGSSLRT